MSDQAKVFPQFETINPLGLTITEFHENRISVDPIAGGSPAQTPGSRPCPPQETHDELRADLAVLSRRIARALARPAISDLMINGATGVYADQAGLVQQIPLSTPYTNERLTAAIERVARILGQELTNQNPILNTRLPDGSRVAVVGAPSSINGPTLTIRKFNRW